MTWDLWNPNVINFLLGFTGAAIAEAHRIKSAIEMMRQAPDSSRLSPLYIWMSLIVAFGGGVFALVTYIGTGSREPLRSFLIGLASDRLIATHIGRLKPRRPPSRKGRSSD